MFSTQFKTNTVFVRSADKGLILFYISLKVIMKNKLDHIQQSRLNFCEQVHFKNFKAFFNTFCFNVMLLTKIVPCEGNIGPGG